MDSEHLADDLHKLTALMVFVQGPALVAPVSPAKSIGWVFVLLGDRGVH